MWAWWMTAEVVVGVDIRPWTLFWINWLPGLPLASHLIY